MEIITVAKTKYSCSQGEIPITKLKCEVSVGPTLVRNSAGLVD